MRGRAGGSWGGDTHDRGTQARRKQTKWPRYASGERWRGQLAGSLPSSCSGGGRGCRPPSPSPVPPARPPGGRPAGLGTAAPSPPRFARPRAAAGPRPRAAGRASRLEAGGDLRLCVCVCLSLPGCPLRAANVGPEDRRYLRSFVERGKGAEQSKHKPERFVIRLCKKDSGA